MERITISLDSALAEDFDRFTSAHGYRNRSEAIRDLIRQKLESERLEQHSEGDCVGTLTYIYNHEERELSRRLTQVQHDHHDLAVSTLHIHLDHDNCLETVVVMGGIHQVRRFADSVISRPGVRHGKLYLVPVDVEDSKHTHGQKKNAHSHHSPHT
jgi:CopG family transcriptional regulator, nickel-responsive regulator